MTINSSHFTIDLGHFTRNQPYPPSLPKATGDGLSLLTVGSYGYFTITARDSLNLARDLPASQRLAFSATTGVSLYADRSIYFVDRSIYFRGANLVGPFIIVVQTKNRSVQRHVIICNHGA